VRQVEVSSASTCKPWRRHTCSGGMRHSARNPSWVSTGVGGRGGHSAARRTASTCVKYRRQGSFCPPYSSPTSPGREGVMWKSLKTIQL
jgi:hypothetical protein